MRRLRKTSSILLVGVMFLATILAVRPQHTNAACAPPSPAYGEATISVDANTSGTYYIWSRMMAPVANADSYLLEVDGTNCYTVGDTGFSTNTWTWIDSGISAQRISQTLSAGTHTIRMIGREPGVKVDRLLVVSDASCTPSGLGDNCTEVGDTTAPTVSITSPTSGASVSGKINITANATDDKAVTKVEFYVNNVLKSTATASPYAFAWDTSVLANGNYDLGVKAFDAAGNAGTSTVAVSVKNGDSTAPTVPTSLTVKADSSVQTSLTWTKSSDDTAVVGYRILRDGVVIGTTPTTTYVDKTVAPQTKYAYQVSAYDGANNSSAASDSAQITTPASVTADTQAPTAPTSLTATAISKSQINVAWKASTDNVAVKEYDVFRSSGSNVAAKIATTSTTSFGDGSLATNTTYSYYVVARDTSGNVSSPSINVSATTAKDAPPSVPSATGAVRGTVQGRNRRPVEDARVTVWAQGKRYSATTNWRGQYTLNNLPTGNYSLDVRAQGYRSSSVDVRIRADKTLWQDIRLKNNQ